MTEDETQLLAQEPISQEKHVRFAPLPVDEVYPFARPILIKSRSKETEVPELRFQVEFDQLRTPYFRQRPKWFAYLLVTLLMIFFFFVLYWMAGKLLLFEVEEQTGRGTRHYEVK
jgi:hypothetical protein